VSVLQEENTRLHIAMRRSSSQEMSPDGTERITGGMRETRRVCVRERLSDRERGGDRGLFPARWRGHPLTHPPTHTHTHTHTYTHTHTHVGCAFCLCAPRHLCIHTQGPLSLSAALCPRVHERHLSMRACAPAYVSVPVPMCLCLCVCVCVCVSAGRHTDLAGMVWVARQASSRSSRFLMSSQTRTKARSSPVATGTAYAHTHT
jgi:hypothetical protein